MADKRKGKKYGLRERSSKVKQPNQWTGTPQQEEFLVRYMDPKSPTFANPYESAMEAGYSESYARIIAQPSVNRQWIQEARNIVSMHPEHIVQGLQQFALDTTKKDEVRLRALELLGKSQGIFIERKQILHANIDEALREFDI